jgi:hypothetical protein
MVLANYCGRFEGDRALDCGRRLSAIRRDYAPSQQRAVAVRVDAGGEALKRRFVTASRSLLGFHQCCASAASTKTSKNTTSDTGAKDAVMDVPICHCFNRRPPNDTIPYLLLGITRVKFRRDFQEAPQKRARI